MIPWSPTSAGSQMRQDTVVPVSQHRSDKSAREINACPSRAQKDSCAALPPGWRVEDAFGGSPQPWGSPGSLCVQSCPTLSDPVDYNK